jgi:hypothetical protein
MELTNIEAGAPEHSPYYGGKALHESMKAREKPEPSSFGTTAWDKTRLRKWLGKKTWQRNNHEWAVRVHPASPAHRGRDLRRFSLAQRHYGVAR